MANAPNASAPYEWYLGIICEEFGCLPTQAQRELERDPLHLLPKIMMLRQYARVKQQLDRRLGGSGNTIPDSVLLRTAMHNTERFVAEFGGIVPWQA